MSNGKYIKLKKGVANSMLSVLTKDQRSHKAEEVFLESGTRLDARASLCLDIDETQSVLFQQNIHDNILYTSYDVFAIVYYL